MNVAAIVVGLVVGVAQLGGCAASVVGEAAADEGSQWVSLFNGRDLDGWIPKFAGFPLGVNHLDTFRVEDGELVVSYDNYESFDGAFGHLFYVVPCEHYRLRLQYRFTGEQTPGGPGWAYRNSGVMIHGQAPETMGLNQSFPVSIEVQLLGGDGQAERPTGNLCTPGTHVEFDGVLERRHCTNSSSPTFHGDEWVTMEIEVHGHESIVHLINGQVVLSYGAPQLDINDTDAQPVLAAQGGDVALRGGTLSLQAESHPCAFRAIELLPLPATDQD